VRERLPALKPGDLIHKVANSWAIGAQELRKVAEKLLSSPQRVPQSNREIRKVSGIPRNNH
jgi:hypothetical protein